MKTVPDFSFETDVIDGFTLSPVVSHNNSIIVAGIDEAGRGPLCGPVVAGAVIFPSRFYENPPEILITDSKKMTTVARAAAFDWIVENCIVGVGQCSPVEIDELNILWASMLAMKRAIADLKQQPDFCLIDGNRIPKDLFMQAKPIVKGDRKTLSIVAASFIAKETRDKIMSDLAEKFPQYGWDKNAGYPTQSHLQAIKKYGINDHYRKTFKPIKEYLNENS